MQFTKVFARQFTGICLHLLHLRNHALIPTLICTALGRLCGCYGNEISQKIPLPSALFEIALSRLFALFSKSGL